MIGGRVLDTSALVDFAASRSVYTQAAVWHAAERGVVLAVPTTALTAATAQLSHSAHDVLRVLLHLPITVVEELREPDTWRVARTLNAVGSRTPESLTAGHVVASSQQRGGWPVITSMPDPLRALDPDVTIERLPY